MAAFVATRPNCDFIQCSAKTEEDVS
uniref:Uncharacterized protein n=1 Tax=Romanomermis culicivorax TaxID=13658 RepID=A0A915KFP9_ROMCU